MNIETILKDFDEQFCKTHKMQHFLQQDVKTFLLSSHIKLLEEMKESVENKMSVGIDENTLLPDWERYWLKLPSGRFIERCIECGNYQRFQDTITSIDKQLAEYKKITN